MRADEDARRATIITMKGDELIREGDIVVTDKATGKFVTNSTGHSFKAIPCVDANGQPILVEDPGAGTADGAGAAGRTAAAGRARRVIAPGGYLLLDAVGRSRLQTVALAFSVSAAPFTLVHETAHGQWHDTTWREFGNRVAAFRGAVQGTGIEPMLGE